MTPRCFVTNLSFRTGMDATMPALKTLETITDILHIRNDNHNTFRRSISASILRILVCLAIAACACFAQEQTGTIEGRAKDKSAASMPEVTVSIGGPNLLGGKRSVLTGENGTYLLRQIPIGTYQLTFAKDGFASTVVEGVRVQAGTVFTVDAELGLASVQQSVTTVATAPVLDTTQNQVAFTYTSELMDTVPNARDAWALVSQIPGVTSQTFNVGGTNSGNQTQLRGNGVDHRQNTYLLNGANITDNTSNGASQFFFDVDSVQELQVSVNAHSAEVQTPGIVMNIIPKSGTNQFHGSLSGYYTDDRLSSSNLDDKLRARGVTTPNKMRQYFDLGADFGGPAIKDKLWFFGSYRYTGNENIITGTRLPSGEQPIDRTFLWYPTVKVDWRPSDSHNISGFFNLAQKKRFRRDLGPLRPPETSRNQQGAPIARLFTVRDDWTVSPTLVVSFKANVMDQGFELVQLPGVDVENIPNMIELSTNRQSGAPPAVFGIGKTMRQYSGTASWFRSNFLGGSHSFKFGLEYAGSTQFGNQAGGVAKNVYPADHQARFFNGVPTEVILYASDASSVKNPTWSGFAQDNWKLGRVTLNLGLRWDWQGNKYAEVVGPQSRFFTEPSRQEATDNVITWNTVAPRLGIVWDVTGKSKTLLKASYGRYNWQLWTNIADAASPAGTRSVRRRWNDANGDRLFRIEEAGDVLEVNDPSANRVRIDTDLKPTFTDELVVGVSHELAPNFAIGS
ncbi:MAG: TonB-dependent receptor, partial [Bryobacteraceae bacterium]|nr:TonB-dependent receptor [Bryobacteraceae bacterium]